MSYQVLARKWRPSNFAQVAGQTHVLKSLINALDNERLHHAYLFTGTRGVGKTTLARILAKCLNCEQGISSKPCEECSACNEINEGRFIDLIEVDAASRTKVEDTRELLDNVQYTPSRGRFKVYLIDEVHMLSNHSFNALLKTLEEPPPHVKFLFATTDPQKLPVTILSRCLQLNLKNLSPKVIVEYLQKVLLEEDVKHDEDALWQIAAAAAGSMRDALTLVDQAISYCQGSVEQAGVIEMLGVPEQQQVFALLDAMAKGDITAVLTLVNTLSDQSPDYAHTLDSLLSNLHRLAVAQAAPDSLDNSYGDKEQLLALAKEFSGEDIQLFYQIGVNGRVDLRSGVDIRSAFEMLLIRMMAFSPTLVNQDLEPHAGDTTVDVEAPSAPLKKKNEVSATTEKEAAAEKLPPSTIPDFVASTSIEEKSNPVTETAEPGQVNGAATCSSEPGSVIKLDQLNHQSYLEMYRELGLTGIAANVLANSQLEKVKNNQLLFLLDESQSAVYSNDILPRLNQAFSEYFHHDIEVCVEIAAVTAETPAQMMSRLKQERQDDLVQQFEQDGNVQQLVDRFSAVVSKDSITSVKN